jgi:hypothetical protein
MPACCCRAMARPDMSCTPVADQGGVEAVVLDLLLGLGEEAQVGVQARLPRAASSNCGSSAPCGTTTTPSGRASLGCGSSPAPAPGRRERRCGAGVAGMQAFGAALVDLVLRRLHVADEAVAVAVVIDVGREHDIFARIVLALLVDAGSSRPRRGWRRRYRCDQHHRLPRLYQWSMTRTRRWCSSPDHPLVVSCPGCW